MRKRWLTSWLLGDAFEWFCVLVNIVWKTQRDTPVEVCGSSDDTCVWLLQCNTRLRLPYCT